MGTPNWIPPLDWPDMSRVVCLTDCVMLDETAVKADHIGHLLSIGIAVNITADEVEPSDGV